MMPTIQEIYKSANEAYNVSDIKKGNEEALKLIKIMQEKVADMKDSQAKDTQQHKQAVFVIMKLWIDHALENSEIVDCFSSHLTNLSLPNVIRGDTEIQPEQALTQLLRLPKKK